MIDWRMVGLTGAVVGVAVVRIAYAFFVGWLVARITVDRWETVLVVAMLWTLGVRVAVGIEAVAKAIDGVGSRT